MPGVVSRRPLAVAGQLLLGQVPEISINDGGHRHRDPFLDRSEGVAVTITRAEILEPRPATRLDPIDGPTAIVPALPLVGRVGQDADDSALRPAPSALSAGWDAALAQALADRVGTQLFLDQPAVHLAHHRRLA